MAKDSFVIVNGDWLTIEDLCCVAEQSHRLILADSEDFIRRINRGAEWVESLLAEQGFVYGVTTGFGDSCSVSVPNTMAHELARNLYLFHGCGLGEHFDECQTRAILVARIVSLAQGYSGIRYVLLQHLTSLLEHGILPLIPQEGSVGASGDLTPLSYIAAVLSGEREVLYQGQRQPTAQAFSQLRLQALSLRPKETLAIMNGTAVMTGLACLAWQRSAYLSKVATRITALVSIALRGNPQHFDETLFQVKPHPGPMRVAQRLRADLRGNEGSQLGECRLQDRYSLRCAPHIIGVLEDALPWLRQFIETELNSANDNPIIDADNQRVLHGGHFYGGHIAFAMDSLKTAVANIADLLDRQIAQLVDPKFNNGLPANLSGASGDNALVNHGFKAVQIAVSAWTAEALKLTLPASVFSRSTECHNQDKVSMGTIAARDCLRVLELTEQVAAAVLLAAVQATELRQSLDSLAPALRQSSAFIRNYSPFLENDRALEQELRETVRLIQKRLLPLYEDG